MRRTRRLTAFLTALLMLHVGIASGSMVCRMTGGAMQMVGMSHPDAGAEHQTSHDASHRPAHPHGEQDSHCPTPCTPIGCASMGHCGTLSITHDALGIAHSTGAGDIARRQIDVLTSISTAPEPPPPRA